MADTKRFLERALDAIRGQDAEALEGLRDDIRPEHVAPLVRTWEASLPWAIKDGYAALLMDQSGSAVAPVMADALDSPTAEIRAYALCSLTGNFDLFDSLLTAGMVDAQKVAAAVNQYRAG